MCDYDAFRQTYTYERKDNRLKMRISVYVFALPHKKDADYKILRPFFLTIIAPYTSQRTHEAQTL